MRCDEFENRIHDLLDRRLAPEEDDQLLGHAIQCERCQSTLEVYRDLWTGLDAFELPTLQDRFSEDTVALAMGTRSPCRRRPTWLVAAAIAIATSLLVAVMWHDARKDATPGPPPIAQTPEREPAPLPPEPSPAIAQLQPWPETGPLASIATGQVPLDWQALLSEDRLAPVSDIAGRIEPITSNLSAAIHALRSTIPLGKVQSDATGSKNSARAVPFSWKILPT